jgi:DNA-binding transcriptional ArsR family regulator
MSGIPRETVRRKLKRMAEHHLIMLEEDGAYRIIEDSPTVRDVIAALLALRA